MAFPAFTSTEETPITIRKNTLLTGGAFSNQAMRVDYSVPAAGTSTGFPVSAFVSFQIGAGCTVADATLLYMYTDWDTAPSGASRFLRMDDNGTYPADNWIELSAPGAASGPASVIKTNRNTSNSWHKDAAVGSQGGYLKCEIGSTTKYIALYNAA